MKRILFVDDDTNVLAGLRRTLRVMRNDWDMDFVDSPADALNALREKHFDVIVSDMRMPDMDGAQLLRKIKQEHPDSIRIILSGDSNSEMIMRSINSTHQYLAKPCAPDKLKSTIQRAYTLKKLVENDAIGKAVSSIGELPTIASNYQEVAACLDDPESTLSDIQQIICKDIGMTTKVLQLVNSAFFGISDPVTSIESAVNLLGRETLRTLVISHGMFSRHDDSENNAFNSDFLWRYSARCAAIAKLISELEGDSVERTEEAFVGGMLHDVGRLVLASERPEEYAEVMKQIEDNDCPEEQVEREMLGATHSEVGAYLVGLWGLPDSIVEAVAFHETPSRCSGEFGLYGIVHVASRLAHHSEISDPESELLGLDLDYMKSSGMIERWPDWHAACNGKFSSAVV